MAFATHSDVATRLGRDLTSDEQATATAVIELVEGQIVEVSGEAAPATTPAYYKALCIQRAVDALSRPSNTVAAESLGQYAVTYSRESDELGVFLSPSEERTVRRIANNAVSGSSQTHALPHEFVTEPE